MFAIGDRVLSSNYSAMKDDTLKIHQVSNGYAASLDNRDFVNHDHSLPKAKAGIDLGSINRKVEREWDGGWIEPDRLDYTGPYAKASAPRSFYGSKPFNMTAGVENVKGKFKAFKKDVVQGVENYKALTELVQDANGLWHYVRKNVYYALPVVGAGLAFTPEFRRYGHGLYRDGLGGHNLGNDFLQEIG